MSTPFKMKGMSFGNSPMHQDEKKLMKKGTKYQPKYMLKVATKVDGDKEYFKVDEKGKNIKISESEYNTLKGNK